MGSFGKGACCCVAALEPNWFDYRGTALPGPYFIPGDTWSMYWGKWGWHKFTDLSSEGTWLKQRIEVIAGPGSVGGHAVGEMWEFLVNPHTGRLSNTNGLGPFGNYFQTPPADFDFFPLPGLLTEYRHTENIQAESFEIDAFRSAASGLPPFRNHYKVTLLDAYGDDDFNARKDQLEGSCGDLILVSNRHGPAYSDLGALTCLVTGWQQPYRTLAARYDCTAPPLTDPDGAAVLNTASLNTNNRANEGGRLGALRQFASSKTYFRTATTNRYLMVEYVFGPGQLIVRGDWFTPLEFAYSLEPFTLTHMLPGSASMNSLSVVTGSGREALMAAPNDPGVRYIREITTQDPFQPSLPLTKTWEWGRDEITGNWEPPGPPTALAATTDRAEKIQITGTMAHSGELLIYAAYEANAAKAAVLPGGYLEAGAAIQFDYPAAGILPNRDVIFWLRTVPLLGRGATPPGDRTNYSADYLLAGDLSVPITGRRPGP